MYSLTSCRSWKESSRVSPTGNTRKLNKFLKYLGAYYRQCMNGNELKIYFKRKDTAEETNDEDRLNNELEYHCNSQTSIETSPKDEPWAIFTFGKTDLLVNKIGFHQLSLERLENDSISIKPDHELDMKGQIIGLSVTPDQEYLFVLVIGSFDVSKQELRTKLDDEVTNDEYYVIKKIDLNAFQDIGVCSFYKTKNEKQQAALALPPVFPNFLGISKNYLATNSEDNDLYVWDKSYGILLTKIKLPMSLLSVSDDLFPEFNKQVIFAEFDPENEEALFIADANGLSISYSRSLSLKQITTDL